MEYSEVKLPVLHSLKMLLGQCVMAFILLIIITRFGLAMSPHCILGGEMSMNNACLQPLHHPTTLSHLYTVIKPTPNINKVFKQKNRQNKASHYFSIKINLLCLF
jgi:hypothetical protein